MTLEKIRRLIFKMCRAIIPVYRGEHAGSEWIDIWRIVRPSSDDAEKIDPIDLITGRPEIGSIKKK